MEGLRVLREYSVIIVPQTQSDHSALLNLISQIILETHWSMSGSY